MRRVGRIIARNRLLLKALPTAGVFRISVASRALTAGRGGGMVCPVPSAWGAGCAMVC